ncbi:FAD-dependent oxidoreductase, partial [Clostridioides difficile]|uniref:FAD-dependent oxidoreductase n=1 Tax=Clostridioides difficile TaxID=1496 RepID=UPI003F8D63A2
MYHVLHFVEDKFAYIEDGTGIEYDRGIIIDDMCQTTQKDIYAAGDVVGKNAIWPLAVK